MTGVQPPRWRDARNALNEASSLLQHEDGGKSLDNFLALVSDVSTVYADFVLYLGAGVTITARPERLSKGSPEFNPPGWIDLVVRLFEDKVRNSPHLRSQLLERWYRRFRISVQGNPEPSLQTLLASVDRLQLAWLIGQLYERRDRDARIREHVQPQDEATSALVRAIVELPTTTVVTTNYDDIMLRAFEGAALAKGKKEEKEEQAARAADGEGGTLAPPVVIHDEQSLRASFNRLGLRFFYLHGSVNIAGSRVVFDRFDYADLMSRRDGLLDHVTYLLRGKPAIYLGFGLDDPSFNLMENRLFSFDRTWRPDSYAFVSLATAEEQAWWETRNLHLIRYSKDAHLPRLLSAIVATRQFLCWAEPRRPQKASQHKDRTEAYFQDALSCYAMGQYTGAIDAARAALASTLFWGGVKNEFPVDPAKESGDFERGCRLIDIRIRLGLSHYKLRYVEKGAIDRADVNIREAEKVIKYMFGQLHNETPPEGGSSGGTESQANQRPSGSDVAMTRYQRLQIYAGSLLVLKARMAYSLGNYASAGEMCTQVVNDLRTLVAELLASFQKAYSYEQLKAIEVFSYALCQASRVAYQFVTEEPGANRRVGEAQRLSEHVQLLREFMPRFRRSGDGRRPGSQTDRYFLQSLTTLLYVAQWFEARHLIGGFTDVIPTVRERSDDRLLERIKRAILLLEDPPIEVEGRGDGGEAERETGLNANELAHGELADGRKASVSQVSKRWQALRYRYLARAYGLRWFISRYAKRDSPRDASDLDLQYAAGFIDAAFKQVEGSELHRNRVINHIEMARLTVVSLYGQVLCSVGQATKDDDLVFGVATALHHLRSTGLRRTDALGSVGRPQVLTDGLWRETRDSDFLRVLAVRLDAYVTLLCTVFGLPLNDINRDFPPIIDPRLRAGRVSDDSAGSTGRHYAGTDAVELFRAYGTKFDGTNLARRLKDFEEAFISIQQELLGLATNAG